MDIVTVRTKYYRKKSAGYQYGAKPDGSGAWSEADTPEPVAYYVLACNGMELAGVWIDEAQALSDAAEINQNADCVAAISRKMQSM